MSTIAQTIHLCITAYCTDLLKSTEDTAVLESANRAGTGRHQGEPAISVSTERAHDGTCIYSSRNVLAASGREGETYHGWCCLKNYVEPAVPSETSTCGMHYIAR